jgi:signal transduction histidine kinase/phage shock protein PspC (stress-responsive transcriptional regulator)
MTDQRDLLRAPPRAPLARRVEGRMIAGVAVGLSEHLDLSVRVVRFGFVLLSFLSGMGVVAYLALWVFMPRANTVESAAGLDAAARRGMRPASSTATQRADTGILVSGGMIAVGILWAFVVAGAVPSNLFWPAVLGGAGVIVIWLQVDERVPHAADQVAVGPWGRFTRGGGAMSVLRLMGGLLLVLAGVTWILATRVGLAQLPGILGASALLLAGLVVVAAPWLYQQRGRIRRAEAERLRAEARSDMAAHLHDSVLQTLALIQRQAGDAATVSALARKQERELRTWLYGETPRDESLRAALAAIASDVESNFPINVEVVCVGDAQVDDRVQALVQAVREAVINAAKHSQSPRVDVYAEVLGTGIEAFVRDRGVGFDPASVPEGRMGVRESIKARLERHGGTAVIRSEAGTGTEVRLEI